MSHASTFGKLLTASLHSIASVESKAAWRVDAELGEKCCRTGSAIQHYKAGHIPPDVETVEVLARAGVTRGYMNRQWLLRFLHTAGYHAILQEKLLEELYPREQVGNTPSSVVSSNLPPAPYVKFIPRRRDTTRIFEALRQPCAIVFVTSLGGMGKTSLVYDIAVCCRDHDQNAPSFDAIVWISDKPRPGTTTLRTIFDTIAQTLDFPKYSVIESQREKEEEIGNRLRQQAVLLIIDNFETITDPEVTRWIQNIPPPSKALVTARQNIKALNGSASTISMKLDGLDEKEAIDFIQMRMHWLEMDELTAETLMSRLAKITSGNPMAIELILGQLKYDPFGEIIDNLDVGIGIEVLLQNLFDQTWLQLTGIEQQIFKTAALFAEGASREALVAVAEIPIDQFNGAVERLVNFALLGRQFSRKLPRYVLHPLNRVFGREMLRQDPVYKEKAYYRWVHWYVQLAKKVGACFDNVTLLDLLDGEQENLLAVMEWAVRHEQFRDVFALARGVRYYFHVRMDYVNRIRIDQLDLEAAQKLPDAIEEVKALAYYIWTVSQIPDMAAEAGSALEALKLKAQAVMLPEGVASIYHQALAQNAMAHGQYAEALDLWQRSYRKKERRTNVEVRRNIARCLLALRKFEIARQEAQQSLEEACAYSFQRHITLCSLVVARIELAWNTDCQDNVVEEMLQLAERWRALCNSLQIEAEMEEIYGRFYLRSDRERAINHFTKADDLYKRVGRSREREAVQLELQRLDKGKGKRTDA